jgi:hypothetical protein
MKPSHLLATALLACACAMLPATPALAADPDQAQKLFDRGVDAMEAKRFDQACPDIEASYKLDPRPGTLFTLAECEAQRGRLATAADRYEDYLALYETLSPDKKAKQGDREVVARRQKDTLRPQAPQLTLELGPGAPRETTVLRDGAVVPASTLGTPVSVDPGVHRLSTQAPGGLVTEVEVTLKKGERKLLTLQVAVRSGAPSSSAASSSAAAAPEAPAGSEQHDGSKQRLVGLVVGGVGVVGIVAGSALGAVAKGKLGSALSNCPTKTRCPLADQAGVDSAGTLADGSTASFVLGGAALAAGVVVFLTAPSAKAAAPSGWRFTPVVGRTGVSGVLEGSF